MLDIYPPHSCTYSIPLVPYLSRVRNHVDDQGVARSTKPTSACFIYHSFISKADDFIINCRISDYHLSEDVSIYIALIISVAYFVTNSFYSERSKNVVIFDRNTFIANDIVYGNLAAVERDVVLLYSFNQVHNSDTVCVYDHDDPSDGEIINKMKLRDGSDTIHCAGDCAVLRLFQDLN